MGFSLALAGRPVLIGGLIVLAGHDVVSAPGGRLPLSSSGRLYPSYDAAVEARGAEPMCKVCPCPIVLQGGLPPPVAPMVVKADVLVDLSTSVLTVGMPGPQTPTRSLPVTAWADHIRALLEKQLPGSPPPKQRCVPDCNTANLARRASDLAGGLDGRTQEATGDKGRRLVVFLTDGRHWTGTGNECSKSARKILRDAVARLVAPIDHVRLVLFLLDGTGCDGFPGGAKSSELLCPSPGEPGATRCTEIHHVVTDSALSAEAAKALGVKLDTRIIEQIGTFFPHTLTTTYPDPRFPDAVLVGTDQRFHCSGVVLDAHTALTAGHCLPATRLRTGDAENEQGLPSPAKQIVVGSMHACALLSDASVACWGYGGHGELGLGVDVGSATLPTVVPGLPPALGVSACDMHTCALLEDGTARCWGNDSAYTKGSFTPVAVPGTAGTPARRA